MRYRGQGKRLLAAIGSRHSAALGAAVNTMLQFVPRTTAGVMIPSRWDGLAGVKLFGHAKSPASADPLIARCILGSLMAAGTQFALSVFECNRTQSLLSPR